MILHRAEKLGGCISIVGLVLMGLCFGVELAQADNNNDDDTATPAAITGAPTSAAAIVPSSTPKPSGKKGNPKAGRVCPKGCTCDEDIKRLICTGDQFKTFQDLASLPNLTSIDIRGSPMDSVDLNSLSSSKDSLENLDLSNNMIKSFLPPSTSKKGGDSFSKLKSLSLGRNRMTNLSKLSAWKFPSLETLDLSGNLDLTEINQNDFNNTRGLQTLNIQNLKLKSIHELAFNPLSQLRVLNMTGVRLENHLGDKQFIGNQKLDLVDLTDNDLIEVPFALRSTASITRLILNMNGMQSLRQSDFINRTKLTDLEVRRCLNLTKIDDLTFSDLISLKRLIITDNPNLSSISEDCFKSKSNHTLDLFDIRDNNLTSQLDFASLEIKQLLLSGNPWHCDCNLLWFQTKFTAQTRPSAHCKTPDQFRDMEIGEFVSTLDCDQVDSAMRTVVVCGFFLFLFILTVGVFVQKSEICRRFLWRDQYGTIYYTKASFPPETI